MTSVNLQSLDKLTPVERRGSLWLKRDDLFNVFGVSGGKARACLYLMETARREWGCRGVVACGARFSPQIVRVTRIAEALHLECHLHVPSGKPTVEMEDAAKHGAIIHREIPGYKTVIVKRAADNAQHMGFLNIPFGAECLPAANLVAGQVRGLPDVDRIVVPVGSGTTLAGILRGLNVRQYEAPLFKTPKILGVTVGNNPTKCLDSLAPSNWRKRVELVAAPYKFEDHIEAEIEGVKLHPIYEAKAVSFLQDNDLFWIVGADDTDVG